MVMFEAGACSVPHHLLGATVWVRVQGRGADEQVVITHVGADGPSRSPAMLGPPHWQPEDR